MSRFEGSRSSVLIATGDGIEVEGDSAVIVGNSIGVDASGNADGNRIGVRLIGTGAVVGGTDIVDRNVLSGNDRHGVRIRNGASGNVVQGNYIGVDWSGTSDLGNGITGISISENAEFNTIGGGFFW